MDCLQVSQMFTDNMVLQRDCRIPVWGKAGDGLKVTVEFCGQVQEAEAIKGEWFVLLDPQRVGGPYEMKITSGSDHLVFSNILIGEVWVAGGQSNMEFRLKGSLNNKEEILQANYNNIRHYNVPRIAYEEADTFNSDISQSIWQVCNPQNVGNMSAVAYYFAKNVSESIGVPVGIIDCNWGGTSAACWMSEERLSGDSDIRIYLDEYYENLKCVGEKELDRQMEEYDKQVKEYNEKYEQFILEHPDADQAYIEVHNGCYPWPPPMGRKSFMRPAGLYYTMLKKVIPYGIRGAIYYQGEADVDKAFLYRKLLKTLIQNWRDDWKKPEMSFLFVQLTSYANGNPEGGDWASLRESQQYVADNTPHTAMAITIDCGDKDNIHPINKKPVGERLALLAQAKVYGKDISSSGPVYSYMEIDGRRAVIHFDHVESGLVCKTGNLKGFQMCGEEGVFVDAEAEIMGNTVKVYSQSISRPTGVRYGWMNYTEANLFNKEGLPASPFKSER